MAKIAVDAVLLPCPTMTEIAIRANRQLTGSPPKIVLGKTRCLPHISLAMGCLERSDIDSAHRICREIAQEYPPLKLTATAIRTSTNSAGEKVSAFEIKKVQPLQSLHEDLMRRLAPHLSHDVTADMLCSGKASDSSLSWIATYPLKSSFENFYPHITIGYGQIEPPPMPIDFTAGELALCHLADHCTCRTVLFSLPLGKSAKPKPRR